MAPAVEAAPEIDTEPCLWKDGEDVLFHWIFPT